MRISILIFIYTIHFSHLRAFPEKNTLAGCVCVCVCVCGGGGGGGGRRHSFFLQPPMEFNFLCNMYGVYLFHICLLSF